MTSALARVGAFFAAIHAIWKSWPGTLFRFAAAAAVLSTVAANAIAVPLVNARAVPAAEHAAAAATRRSISLAGVEWVSPPGLLGFGPLVKVGAVSVGPGPVERSEGTLGSATVSVRPLRSVLQRRVVLDADISSLFASVRQADNYSWFGFPDDTEPSSRELFPPADDSEAAGGGGGRGAGVATRAAPPAGGAKSGGAPSSKSLAVHEAPASEDTRVIGADVVKGAGIAGRADAAVRARRKLVSGAEAVVAEVLAAARDALVERAVGDGMQSASGAAAALPGSRGDGGWVTALPLASASAAAAGGTTAAGGEGRHEERGSLPPVVVRRVTASDASIDAFVYGDAHARQFRNVAADLRLGRGYGTLGLEVTGDAVARDARCLRCTMPTPEAPRNLRSVTEGAEAAVPANSYPITQQGPSPASLAAYAEGADQRKLQNIPASFGSGGIGSGWPGGQAWDDDGFGGLGWGGGGWEGGVDARMRRDQNAPPADVFSHPIDSVTSAAAPAPRGGAVSGGAQSTGRSQPNREVGAQGQEVSVQGGDERAGEGVRLPNAQSLRGPVPLFPAELLSPFTEAAENEATFPPFGAPFGVPVADAGEGIASASPTAPPSSGGRLTIRVSGRDLMTENVWPKCDVAITGESLHAPLIERLFELPMDIYGGRCDGELQILMRDEDDWNVFPQFGGRIMVRDGAFHFWDAPDDFSGTEMDLRFEGETCHLVGGRGRFGAVPLRASGRLGMNPETGQYDLRAEIPPADVNAVRATLGARPLPYPVAGAVQGHLTCYGALETPIFSGRVRSAREGRWLGGGGGGGEVSDAEEALRAAREAGHEADLALDKVALQCAPQLLRRFA